MSATATIRVPVKTRDWLAAVAADRQQSLASYLTELARQEHRAAIIAAAREEALEFEQNPEARAEFELWEGTLEYKLNRSTESQPLFLLRHVNALRAFPVYNHTSGSQ